MTDQGVDETKCGLSPVRAFATPGHTQRTVRISGNPVPWAPGALAGCCPVKHEPLDADSNRILSQASPSVLNFVKCQLLTRFHLCLLSQVLPRLEQMTFTSTRKSFKKQIAKSDLSESESPSQETKYDCCFWSSAPCSKLGKPDPLLCMAARRVDV